jgi:hypothetical protein
MRHEPEREIGKITLVTEDDLARARRDPAFRYQLVANNLRLLLDEIERMRAGRGEAADCKEIREGAKLAVKLSELLAKLAGTVPGGSRTA